MNSVIGFLIVLGVLGATEVPETNRAPEEPVTVEQGVVSSEEIEARRKQIQLTNSWLRSLRQVQAPDQNLLVAERNQ
ncbi:hypothetical protein [Thiohalomonas denitrificans]|uniref:Uncharacterized protein n=1 Tax=Thiohalomonas denitrificans TaxID=415747 RepID=A0A1G5QBZ0_9GAMM|nr:hypothetical protein [Thiohalomonas denitrificans]SCZ59395.1 hypothetical protein SAMN03097708_01853 [Thiohalomonas denitrificans]